MPPAKYERIASLAAESPLFDAPLSSEDTQITSFCAASLSIALASGGHFEFLLDAQPAVSRKEGLFFDMTLSGFMCSEDHASEIFAAKLGPALSKELCLQPHPIRRALELKPALLAKAISSAPELQFALDESIARETARQLGEAIKPAPASARKRM
jgi:hypothetical protein